MRLPPLNAVRAFEAAARLGRIGQAAEELHVTHAAISHQVRRLEDWLGTALFRRAGRGVRLTSAGRELGERLTRDLGDIAGACGDIRRRTLQPALTVACIPSVATRWLIPRMDEFTQRHPDIRVQLAYAPADTLPDADAAEIVIRDLTGEAPADVVREDLLPGASRPVCSPEWLRRHGPVETPEDLAGTTLLHDGDESAWRDWFAGQGVAAPASTAGPVYQDFHLLSAAAIAGHGVALCPFALIGDDLARGHLVQLFDAAGNTDRQYCMLHPHELTPAARRFRDWVLSLAGDAAHPVTA